MNRDGCYRSGLEGAPMSFLDDNEPRPRPTAHPGEPLADLSVDELKERVQLYRAEIERLEREIEAKEKHLKAADTLFRR
jgi:uncharacterized small protein (DUF1192 family)